MSFGDTAIYIGNFPIYYYGIIMVSGVFLATLLAERIAKERKMKSEFLWDAIIWIVFAGIIGARIWHILTPSPSLVEAGITTKYYLTHPLDALNIRNGGLGIPGAVVGGVAALYYLSKRHGQKFPAWLDVIAAPLALGQAIGRWGNFVNQELYGAPTNLPWAITIEEAYRLPEFADVSRYHPIFLYESLWSLATVVFLIWLGRKYGKVLKPGDVFLTYLITYPTIRILLDFLRLDASQVGGFNANQTLMAVVLVLAAGTLIYRHTRPEKTGKKKRN
ncbi:MAG TPA: prolipoprotein diacylglyceryl transferase [Anaerolineales bacterium]|nr:prolipoprotein diacylglyceryl transferase [Anaerolineales bacterium]HRQ91985.1 prolipoprotein diacylglyceryl transferase [Anaerolineales bacterium]